MMGEIGNHQSRSHVMSKSLVRVRGKGKSGQRTQARQAVADPREQVELDSRVEAVKIYGESPPYGDGTGMPNAAKFEAAFPPGTPGPVSLHTITNPFIILKLK